ncbi:MAG: hypothetical protein IT318_08470 [Anaerolineales bacterium]|nr:hypothetical protein [Anaerolineales bacterium]
MPIDSRLQLCKMQSKGCAIMFRRQNDNRDDRNTGMRRMRLILAAALAVCLSLLSVDPGRAAETLPNLPSLAGDAHRSVAGWTGDLVQSNALGHELPWLLELMARVSKVLDQAIDFVAAHLPFSSSKAEPAVAVVSEPAPAVPALTVEQVEASLVAETNAARESAGLPPLQLDATLTLLARQRSQDMIDRDYFSHTDPETGASMVGPYCIVPLNVKFCGENIAGATSLSDAQANVVNRWMASDGHRENVLRPQFGRIGIGIAEGGRWGAIVTQLFAP